MPLWEKIIVIVAVLALVAAITVVGLLVWLALGTQAQMNGPLLHIGAPPSP